MQIIVPPFPPGIVIPGVGAAQWKFARHDLTIPANSYDWTQPVDELTGKYPEDIISLTYFMSSARSAEHVIGSEFYYTDATHYHISKLRYNGGGTWDFRWEANGGGFVMSGDHYGIVSWLEKLA